MKSKALRQQILSAYQKAETLLWFNNFAEQGEWVYKNLKEFYASLHKLHRVSPISVCYSWKQGKGWISLTHDTDYSAFLVVDFHATDTKKEFREKKDQILAALREKLNT